MDDNVSILGVSIPLWLICGVLGAWEAKKKGRDWFGWYVFCAFAGPVGLLLAVLASARPTSARVARPAPRWHTAVALGLVVLAGVAATFLVLRARRGPAAADGTSPSAATQPSVR